MTDQYGFIKDPRTKNVYYQWLLDKINADSKTHYLLLRRLNRVPFRSLIPNDDNRIRDGLALRKEFADDYGLYFVDKSELQYQCTVLEVLIALAKRINNDILEYGLDYWFWLMIDNLGLTEASDDRFAGDGSMYVDDIIDRFIYRTYKRNGEGGLFPLTHPKKDQRKVEIYYQLNEFLNENYPI